MAQTKKNETNDMNRIRAICKEDYMNIVSEETAREIRTLSDIAKDPILLMSIGLVVAKVNAAITTRVFDMEDTK